MQGSTSHWQNGDLAESVEPEHPATASAGAGEQPLRRATAIRSGGHAGRSPFIAADIGGTHARLALVARNPIEGMPEVLAYRVYRCADHPHLEDILRCFCEESGARPRDMVIACAGYEHAGMVVNRNLAWPVRPAQLGIAMGMDEVSLLNDFQALAHATAYMSEAGIETLKAPRAGDAAEEGPVVIIGPGTGLGAAARLPGQPPRVLVTEAGRIQLAARAGVEQQVLAQLAPADSHVPYEAVLCGPGLYRTYLALCALRDRYPTLKEPGEVSAEAMADPESLAHEALSLFCGWLGSFAGDMAMLYGATGGVYLAGGFLSRLLPFMRRSALVERFLDKGVMRPFLNRIPIHVVDHGQLGVIGAASWFLDTRAEAARTVGPFEGDGTEPSPGKCE